MLFQDVPMQGINEMSPCVSPATVEHAYRMYGPVSSLSFSLPLQVLKPRWAALCNIPVSVMADTKLYDYLFFLILFVFIYFILSRPQISLDVRTRAAEGLLFFAATSGGRVHLTLYMSKGRIRLSVGKEKEIFNREKYNDGKWHTVSGPA